MPKLSMTEWILLGIGLIILIASFFERSLFRYMFLTFALAFVYRAVRPKEGEKRSWNLLIVLILLAGFLFAR
ncbi:hypothetical protein [Edaphobacillus lindanitolerans]|uniref:Uncharacterized protein n=1 Tax=Edaphobacillus lindanitolerans TaxID=550447 RepID=A0A1U7PRU4_9BACI|nr:hypothetical protein [Edaphobacillus lindanitolerans]SIT88755.1 hypothetical protein SAMN05428946_2321 [Edaphobacillus lindanitolerans]